MFIASLILKRTQKLLVFILLPVYVSPFSSFKIFLFLQCFWQFSYILPQFDFLWVLSCFGLLSFFVLFTSYGKFSSSILTDIFLWASPFSRNSNCTYVRSVCIVPHVIKALFIFSHFYFLHASVWIDFYCCVFSHSAFIHNAEFMDTEGWLYYVILYEELKHLWILRDNYSSLGPMSSRLFK